LAGGVGVDVLAVTSYGSCGDWPDSTDSPQKIVYVRLYVPAWFGAHTVELLFTGVCGWPFT
jgi:hypothetical protein